ncbi:MAG TPA: FHA domain-containing protein [Anaeromyxobacteraceae bacterium]|nr:FHA domain-containing protein [Anaeromyxobacteraceae bacterium]
MLKCKRCGGSLDLTMSSCPACGTQVELGRLTGILGIVCRACDAYNEPGAKVCASCGAAIGGAAPAPEPKPEPAVAPPPPPPPAAPAPDSTVIRSFQKGGGAATRFVPAAGSHGTPPPPAGQVTTFQPGATTAARSSPVPLVPHCPRCGAEAGPGQFCANCGQPLGARGTQVMAKPPAAGRTATQVFGALAPGRAKLLLERGEGFEGATFRLNADTVEAGRARGAVLFPDDPCLAAHHATFFYRGGALHVRDEGATGGVYLRLRGLSVPLKAGDMFVVGDRLLRYAGLLPPAPPPPPDGTVRLGAPRPAGPAAVIEEWLEGGVAGPVFVRAGPSITIGRTGCAVNLGEDAFLSQAHAELLLEPDGGVRLRDLGSSNGTFVKIPPHAERELRDGDCVRMGREVLRVSVA